MAIAEQARRFIHEDELTRLGHDPSNGDELPLSARKGSSPSRQDGIKPLGQPFNQAGAVGRFNDRLGDLGA